MKKHLLIAAIAATISVPVMADVSIRGDAYMSISDKKDTPNLADNDARGTQRVRLHATGKSGDTKVVAVIRSNGGTRVETGGRAANEGASDIQMDQLYLTTKIGDVNVKVGDWWGTIGAGARSFGEAKPNAISISTKVSDWKFGVYHVPGNSDSTNINAAGKIGPANLKVVYNKDNFADIFASAKFDNYVVGVEYFMDDRGVADEHDTLLVHLGAIFEDIKVDIAYIDNNDVANSGLGASIGGNNKFAPLGSMIVGTAARGGTATAIANVGNFTEITGISAGMKLAGNNVKLIYAKTDGPGIFEGDDVELILTRPLGGAKLTANYGMFNPDLSSADTISALGLRLDVKF